MRRLPLQEEQEEIGAVLVIAMPEQATELPEGERGVTIMLPKDIPLPAFVRIVDERNAIVQQYQPTALDDAERALTVELTQAVKMSLLWFNAHHPTNHALRHAVAEIKERLRAVLAKAREVDE